MKITLPICISGSELTHEYDMQPEQVQTLLTIMKTKVDGSDRPFQIDRRNLIEQLEAVLAQHTDDVK